jgi:hypothetical protein
MHAGVSSTLLPQDVVYTVYLWFPLMVFSLYHVLQEVCLALLCKGFYLTLLQVYNYSFVEENGRKWKYKNIKWDDSRASGGVSLEPRR